MGLGTTFRSFSHAISSGAKYFEDIVVDAIKIVTKVQTLEPAVESIITAAVGPQASAIADLAFHALGDIAGVVKDMNDSAVAAAAEKGINVVLDIKTINSIKNAVTAIENLLSARGTPAPKV